MVQNDTWIFHVHRDWQRGMFSIVTFSCKIQNLFRKKNNALNVLKLLKIQQYMYMYFIIILNSFRCFSLIFPYLLKQFRATLDRYMCKADALAKPVLSMTLEKRWRISGGAQMNRGPVHISCLMSSHFYRKHLQERRLTVTSVASIDKVILYFTAYDKNFTDLKTVENN